MTGPAPSPGPAAPGPAAPGWPRCSFVAEAAGDRLPGSAPPAERWLLLEHPGPWGRHPPAGSGFPAAAVDALSGWARRERGRVLLIRRPGARSVAWPRRWFRVDSRPGREEVRLGLFSDPAGAADAVRVAGEVRPGPLLLACTHGRHDTCCAVRGRPLAAALATVDPEAAWECSHLGGCRFAPTMVLLPHGLVLGRVTPGEASGVVRGYREGVLPEGLVRGRSTFPPAVQAAQHHARAATGVLALSALRPVDWHSVDDGTTGQAVWQIRLEDPAVEVRLVEHLEPAGRPLTCAADSPGLLRRFELVTLRIS